MEPKIMRVNYYIFDFEAKTITIDYELLLKHLIGDVITTFYYEHFMLPDMGKQVEMTVGCGQNLENGSQMINRLGSVLDFNGVLDDNMLIKFVSMLRHISSTLIKLPAMPPLDSNITIDSEDYLDSNYTVFDDYCVAARVRSIRDSFVDSFPNIEKIDCSFITGHEVGTLIRSVSGTADALSKEVEKIKNAQTFSLITITYDGGKSAKLICVDNNVKDGLTIWGLIADDLVELKDGFMTFADGLVFLSIANVKKMGNRCFTDVRRLTVAIMGQVLEMGDMCFYWCALLKESKQEKLGNMGSNCFTCVPSLETVNFRRMKKMGDNCFVVIPSVTSANFENLEERGCNCFYYVLPLSDFDLRSFLNYDCGVELPPKIQGLLTGDSKSVKSFDGETWWFCDFLIKLFGGLRVAPKCPKSKALGPGSGNE